MGFASIKARARFKLWSGKHDGRHRWQLSMWKTMGKRNFAAQNRSSTWKLNQNGGPCFPSCCVEKPSMLHACQKISEELASCKEECMDLCDGAATVVTSWWPMTLKGIYCFLSPVAHMPKMLYKQTTALVSLRFSLLMDCRRKVGIRLNR